MITSKPWRIWSVAITCVLVVVAAMALVTNGFLQQKNQDLKAGTDAYLEERVRLAMWRLDTLAASIVGAEESRPAQELTIANKLNIEEIYNQDPAYTNLHWSVKLDGQSTEAQSPQSDQRGAQNLTKFNQLLAEPATGQSTSVGEPLTNFELTCQSCHELPLPNSSTAKRATILVQQENDFTLKSLNDQAPRLQKNSKIVHYKNAPQIQQQISKAEKGKRQAAVERMSDNYNISGKWGTSAVEQSSKEIISPVAELSNFMPIWLNDELVLVRRVRLSGRETLQGVWLNQQQIVKDLLAEVSDLFPLAHLIPYHLNGDAQSSDNAMVSLPFVLVPQEAQVSSVKVSLAELAGGPIGLAWLGVLLAAVAGFCMLRAVMKMSERRASFVSSVTHELRTPLTTFRLYSDMLSSGLVKDEATKLKYADTLKREADRLSHLVENVLAYSQIERGRASRNHQQLTVMEMLGRIEDRLHGRAAEEQMNLTIEISDADAQREITVDVTAIEQILFNLVDNAAKYASESEQLRVVVSCTQKSLRIAVCDQGGGVSRCEQKRLFQPFHKSAEQAASSKPGVGLGLSLCRRLARAMKGDLFYENKKNGACFVLLIPTALKFLSWA